jgi:hypothetical protein
MKELISLKIHTNLYIKVPISLSIYLFIYLNFYLIYLSIAENNKDVPKLNLDGDITNSGVVSNREMVSITNSEGILSILLYISIYLISILTLSYSIYL